MPPNLRRLPPPEPDNPDAFKPQHPKLREAALQGLPGRVVRELDPYTEADRAAVLVSFLAAAGAMIGNGPHMSAGDVEQPCRLWALIIGPTAGGMKGTSWAAVQRVILRASIENPIRIEKGLSSAEGLIEVVVDSHGQPGDKDFIEGVTDKRLIIVESEFAAVLARGKREGNPLFQTMRDAWDGSQLSTMVRKANRLVATQHHIAVVGHITAEELRAKLTDVDVASGSMNRFLTVCSIRSKKLPDGGGAPQQVVDSLADELRERVEDSGAFLRVERDEAAGQLWVSGYDALTPNVLAESHYSQVVARAVPQLLRLSLTYALLDKHPGKPVIRAEHLDAAVAVWEYVQASAWFVFGDLAANVNLAQLCEAVGKAPGQTLTRTQITTTVFGNNKSAALISELIRQAVATGNYVASTDQADKQGRPATRLTKQTKRVSAPVFLGSELVEDTVTTHGVASSNSLSSYALRANAGSTPVASSTQTCSLCGMPVAAQGRGICSTCDESLGAAS